MVTESARLPIKSLFTLNFVLSNSVRKETVLIRRTWFLKPGLFSIAINEMGDSSLDLYSFCTTSQFQILLLYLFDSDPMSSLSSILLYAFKRNSTCRSTDKWSLSLSFSENSVLGHWISGCQLPGRIRSGSNTLSCWYETSSVSWSMSLKPADITSSIPLLFFPGFFYVWHELSLPRRQWVIIWRKDEIRWKLLSCEIFEPGFRLFRIFA